MSKDRECDITMPDGKKWRCKTPKFKNGKIVFEVIREVPKPTMTTNDIMKHFSLPKKDGV